MLDKTEVIFFDMGNTLINFQSGPSDEIKESIGIQAMTHFLQSKTDYQITTDNVRQQLIDKWMAIMPLRKSLHIEYPLEQFIDPFLMAFKIKLNSEEKINLIDLYYTEDRKHLVVEDGLQEVLSKLASKFRLGIISNSACYSEVNINHFKELNIDHYFEHFLFSYSLLLGKPRPEIFKNALACFDVRPECSCMVGDSLDADIKGAQQLGMQTIWYNPQRKENSTQIIPDHEIISLSEILSLC